MIIIPQPQNSQNAAARQEITASKHIVQFYENDDAHIHTLAEFVAEGIDAGEAVIVIATLKHLMKLNERLEINGTDVLSQILDGGFIPFIAEEALRGFMVNDSPDKTLFMKFANNMLSAPKLKEKKVRVYEDMATVLWENGKNDATIRLEYLWNEFCKKESIYLFCAYAKKCFYKDATSSFEAICAVHTHTINRDQKLAIETEFEPLGSSNNSEFDISLEKNYSKKV